MEKEKSERQGTGEDIQETEETELFPKDDSVGEGEAELKAKTDVKAKESEEESEKDEEESKDNLESLIKKYEEEIEKYKADAEDYKRKWMYTYAEFENYKKRVRVDIENAVKDAVGKVLLEFASALDGITQAMEQIPDENIKKGIELILRVMRGAFEKSGARIISPSPGDDFSPDFCEALAKEESEFDEGKIVKVVREGIEYKGRVIRPALVVVSAGKKNKEREGDSGQSVDVKIVGKKDE